MLGVDTIQRRNTLGYRGRAASQDAKSSETGPAVDRAKCARAGAFAHFEPEVTLLSAATVEGGETAFGSRCRRRNDRKTEREPRTRLGVNLIFYSAARSWCASSFVRVGALSPPERPDV